MSARAHERPVSYCAGSGDRAYLITGARAAGAVDKGIIRIACAATVLAAGAYAQSAAFSFASVTPTVVAPQGRMDVTVLVTNTSGSLWEPLQVPTPEECAVMWPATQNIYAVCPSYPSPGVAANWGRKALRIVAYPAGIGRPYTSADEWVAEFTFPAPIQPGETVAVGGHFAAPLPVGNYELAAMIHQFGCCNFSDRVLNSSQEGYDRSPHFAFRVAADTTPPSLILSDLVAGACEIWPPNNKMVEAGSIRAVDLENAVSNFTVTAVSNDPTTAPGDIEVVNAANGAKAIRLRASRSGAFGDRVYAITEVAADAVGNTMTQRLACTVRHDQRK